MIWNIMDYMERSQILAKEVMLTGCLLMPLELLRATCIVTGILPLLLFAGGEYIVNGNDRYTSIIANTIENGGKQYVQNKFGNDVKVYSKFY